MSTAPTTVELKPKDFKGKVDPDWCPGCGDFGVLNTLQKVCASMGLRPHEIVTVSGIGCSSNFPGYFNAYGMHTLHGRALAVATGVKMANHDLTVIVTGGDGDGYGIGGNHFVHTARRNVDLTYLVMNNQIYGLTTGQVSPSSEIGMKTKSTPFGNVERPVNPITSAIMNGATFVARGYSGDAKHLMDLIKKAIQHKGFALVRHFQPLRDLQSRQHLRLLSATREEIRGRGPRPHRLENGLREGHGVGRHHLHRAIPPSESPDPRSAGARSRRGWPHLASRARLEQGTIPESHRENDVAPPGHVCLKQYPGLAAS